MPHKTNEKAVMRTMSVVIVTGKGGTAGIQDETLMSKMLMCLVCDSLTPNSDLRLCDVT